MNTMEQGHTSRIFYIRIHPNEDLVQSLEKTAIEHRLKRAIVRSSVGSLAHCCLEFGESGTMEIEGPAIEIMNMNGEISCDDQGNPAAHLTGIVMDMEGRFHAGRFASGRNPACMTVEAVIEEWVVDNEVALP